MNPMEQIDILRKATAQIKKLKDEIAKWRESHQKWQDAYANLYAENKALREEIARLNKQG